MPIIGEAHIDIKALTSGFRNDIEKAVKGIKNVGIELKVDADISAASKKIRDLRYRTKNNPVKIAVEVEDSKLESSITRAVKKATKAQLDVTANTSSFDKSIRDLNQRAKNLNVKIPVSVDTKFFERDVKRAIRAIQVDKVKLRAEIDPASVQAVRDAIQKKLVDDPVKVYLDTSDALITAQGLATSISAMRPTMTATANADTGKAAAQLAFLARQRRVPFVVQFEKGMLQSLKGMTEALTGILPEAKIRAALQGITSNFSDMILKFGAMGSAAGAAGAGLAGLAGGALAAGKDVSRLVGLVAAAPAAFTMFYLGMKTVTGAMKGFGTALSGDEKALAALTPSARAAAAALSVVVKEIQPRTQETFWSQATESMQQFARESMPMVSNAMNDMARNAGNALAEVMSHFNELAASGTGAQNLLGEILDNLGEGFAHITDAASPLAKVFTVLGRTGAMYMPALGRAVSELAESFKDFIVAAEMSGDIFDWIDGGIIAFKNLMTIVGSTITIFDNLATAAEKAGFGGLDVVARAMQEVAKASGDVLFQSDLVQFFRDAGAGAVELGEGLLVVADTIRDAIPGIGEFLKIAGDIGKLGFENLDVLLNADGLGDGLMAAVEGFKEGFSNIQPGMEAIGETIGHLGEMAGVMFTTMAPGFNNLMILIEGVVDGIKEGFIAAVPIVNHFVDTLMQIARLPLIGAAEAIGALLRAFAALPGPLQNVVMGVVALTGALRLLGAIGVTNGVLSMGTAFGLIGSKAKGAVGGVTGFVGALRGGTAAATASQAAMAASALAMANAGKMSAGAAKSHQALNTQIGQGKNATGLLAANMAMAGTSVAGFGAKSSTSNTALSKLGGTALMFAKRAGVIGAVITVADMGMSAWNDSVGAAETNTLAASTAMQQYGLSSQEAGEATKGILENSKTLGTSIADQVLSFGGLREVTNYASEGFKTLGWDVNDVGSAINKSGGEWTGYREKLQQISDATGQFGTVSEETSIAILGNTSAAGMNADQIREMINSYDTANRSVEEHVQVQLKAAESARQAADYNKSVADAVVGLTPGLTAAADGYSILGDASSSAGDKMNALQATMAEVQRGYSISGEAAEGFTRAIAAETAAKMSSAEATDNINASISTLSTTYGQVGSSILNAKGELDELNPVARQVYNSMADVATSIQEVGIQTYDAALKNGDSISTATDKAMGAMEPMINNLKSQLSAMGIEGGEAMDIILRQVGLLPSDLRMSINAEGDAAQKIMATKLIAEGLVQGNYDIALGAVDKGALETIATVHGAGQDFALGDYEAVFKAIAEDLGVTEAVQFLQDSAGMDYEAMMNLYAENYASEETNKVLAEGKALDGTKFTARLEAVNNISKEVTPAMAAVKDLDAMTAEAQLEAINNVDPKVREALAKALELSSAEPEVVLGALDAASPTILEAIGMAGQFDGQISEGTLRVINDAGPEAHKAFEQIKALDGATGTARIDAVNKLEEKAREGLAKLLEIDSTDAEAIITAMDKASPVVAEAVAKILSANEAEGNGKVGVTGAEETKTKVDGVRQAIENNNTASGTGNVGVAGADETIAKAQGASSAVSGVGAASGTGNVGVNGAEAVQAKTGIAASSITGLNLASGTGTANLTDNATPKIDPITGKIGELNIASAMPQVGLGGSPAAVREDLDHIQRKLDDIGNKHPQPTVTLNGGAAAVTELQNIVSRTAALSSMQATPRIALSGADAAQSQISTVTGRMGALSGMQATPRVALSGAEGANAGLAGVRSAMAATGAMVASPRIQVTGAEAGNAMIGSVRAQMASLGGVVAMPRIILQGAPAANAAISQTRSLLLTLGSTTAQPRVILQGGPAAVSGIGAVQRVLDALSRTTARPRIDLQGHTQAQGAIDTTKNKLDGLGRTTATPNIILSGASAANAAIDGVRSNLSNLNGQNSNVYITTHKRNANANGGVYESSGAVAFANGGIMQSIQKFANGGFSSSNVQSFASGSENHVAQIARGQWPVRMWAEPETGGEAYIPLHINKRARSLDILEQVAEMFGYSLVKKFADGGILKSISPSNTGHFADGGFNTTKSVSGYVSPRRGSNPVAAGVPATAGNGDQYVFNNHVYPSAKLDEEQVADSVSRSLFWKITNSR